MIRATHSPRKPGKMFGPTTLASLTTGFKIDNSGTAVAVRQSSILGTADMAQYYTLDEASRKLGVTIDEFRKGIATKWKNLRRFPDGPTLRFQAREIDELARTLGRMSEAMPKPPLDEPLPLAEKPSSSSLLKKKAEETATVPPSSDEFIPLADDHVMLPAKA